jgi:hypothetical protein
MTITTIKTSADVLAEGGMPLDLAQISPEQAKAAFERAARETSSVEDRTVLAYHYMAQMMQDMQDIVEQDEETMAKKVTPAAKKKVTKASQTSAPQTVDVSALVAKIEALEAQLSDREEPVAADDDRIAKSAVADILDRVFESLGIPGLGPEPEKPKHKVTFDMGAGGKITSSYHWVSEQDGGLFLVYDSRFEFGTFFEPPSFGKDRTIKVSHSATNRTWNVFSLGFVHNFGIFSQINLIIADEEKADAMISAAEEYAYG